MTPKTAVVTSDTPVFGSAKSTVRVPRATLLCAHAPFHFRLKAEGIIEAEIFAGSATRVVEMTGEACVFAGGIW